MHGGGKYRSDTQGMTPPWLFWMMFCGMKASVTSVLGSGLLHAQESRCHSRHKQPHIVDVAMQVKLLNIPASENFDFCGFLADPSHVREWNIQGLPVDAFSTENGVMVTRGKRWPLMIDPQVRANNYIWSGVAQHVQLAPPHGMKTASSLRAPLIDERVQRSVRVLVLYHLQGQAVRWIKNMEAKSGLKVLSLKASDMVRQLESAVQFGRPLLLADIMEEVDPVLEPLLAKNFIRWATCCG